MFALLLATILAYSHPSSLVSSIPPPYVSDSELASCPVIVVARWNKSPLRAHSNVREKAEGGKELVATESHTELVIERVIKGDIKPGTHKILLGFRIAWAREDGGQVMSYMSTEMMGDVDEVKDSNLWFLAPKRSWDQKDAHTYLALETYRGVQPRALESYFVALNSKNPKRDIPKLLPTAESEATYRILKYICGDVMPWPIEPGFIEIYSRAKRDWEPMREYAGEVESLINRKDAKVRETATAVYAELAGKSAVPRMRQLLKDSDPQVRATAIGILAGHRDQDSVESFAAAAQGITDGQLACKVIERLYDWKSESLVPTLIEFLQNDTFAYQLGDDFGIPGSQGTAGFENNHRAYLSS